MSDDNDDTTSEWSELFRVMTAILTDREKVILYNMLSDMPSHTTWYDLSMRLFDWALLCNHVHYYWLLARDFEPEENEKDAILAILNIPYENTAFSAPPKCPNHDCLEFCRGYKNTWYAGCTLQCRVRVYRYGIKVRCPVQHCGAVMVSNNVGLWGCNGVHTMTKSANKTG